MSFYLITSGIEEQSSRSCIVAVGSGDLKRKRFRIFARTGCSVATLTARLKRSDLFVDREGQKRSRCSKVPGVSEELHSGSKHLPDLFWVQCLCSQSVRYLPDSIFTVQHALCTSNGLGPQAVQIGWGLARDMYLGIKYNKEWRSATSALSLCSQ